MNAAKGRENCSGHPRHFENGVDTDSMEDKYSLQAVSFGNGRVGLDEVDREGARNRSKSSLKRSTFTDEGSFQGMGGDGKEGQLSEPNYEMSQP